MKFKDYYEILGVERGAAQEEVKKSYRRLARKFHPDVSKEKDAEERFKAVNEAYEVLGDARKRAAYDQLGVHRGGQEFRPPPDWRERFGQRGAGASDFGGMNMADLFAQMFGGHGGRQGFTGHARGRDEEVVVRLSLEDAFHGVERSLQLSSPGQAARTLNVRIPAGVLPGRRLRVRGKGGVSGHGLASDLILSIEVEPHPLYRLDGKDIVLETPLAPWEAVLGTSITVPTLTGNVRLRIPAGSGGGQKLRLSGRGMPDASGAGDLLVLPRIVVPAEVSAEVRALYERLAELSKFDPRPNFPQEDSGG